MFPASGGRGKVSVKTGSYQGKPEDGSSVKGLWGGEPLRQEGKKEKSSTTLTIKVIESNRPSERGHEGEKELLHSAKTLLQPVTLKLTSSGEGKKPSCGAGGSDDARIGRRSQILSR